MKLVDLGAAGYAFDLVEVTSTENTSSTQAEFFANSGALAIPEVIIVENGVIVNKFKVDLELDDQATNTGRFIIINLEEI